MEGTNNERKGPLLHCRIKEVKPVTLTFLEGPQEEEILEPVLMRKHGGEGLTSRGGEEKLLVSVPPQPKVYEVWASAKGKNYRGH